MTDRIRTLVVDDEPLAREGIMALLENDPELIVVGEAGNGAAAVRALRSLHPHLVLLDVQMPEMDGIEVVRAIGAESMPAVIFITAYDRFAVEAFELCAVDYLVKPFTDERFHRAIGRAKQAIRQDEVRHLSERLLHLLDSSSHSPAAPSPAAPREPTSTTHLPIREAGRTFFVPAEEIVWIEAEGAYARVHTSAKTHLARETLGAMEVRLDPSRFLRTHRSAIVNIARIRELQAYSRGEYVLLLTDGSRVPLSRRRKKVIDRLLGGRF